MLDQAEPGAEQSTANGHAADNPTSNDAHESTSDAGSSSVLVQVTYGIIFM